MCHASTQPTWDARLPYHKLLPWVPVDTAPPIVWSMYLQALMHEHICQGETFDSGTFNLYRHLTNKPSSSTLINMS